MVHLPTLPPEVLLIIKLAFVVLAVVFTFSIIVHIGRHVRADRMGRKVLRKAWFIKWTWKRTARRVGLTQTEKSRPPIWSRTPQTQMITRELVPKITVSTERWGVRIDAFTLGRLGLKQFQDTADHLADTWQVPQVRIEQSRPGRVTIRALLRDPLTEWTQWTHDATAPSDPATWLAGVDADGQPVTVRTSGVSGVVVAGLAGYGKTSFINARFCQLASCESVQFVLIDGKGGPDYDELFARAWLHAKDEPEKVRDHLTEVQELMVARQHSIRACLKVKNMWHVGPSARWPLVLVIIDLCRT